jgi:hypothetical protein
VSLGPRGCGPDACDRTYTLAGECTTLEQFAATCLRLSGRTGRVARVPAPLVRAACGLGRVLPLPVYPDQLDRLLVRKPSPSDEAPSALGFSARGLENGLATLLGS